jgi:WD40 repeat protein
MAPRRSVRCAADHPRSGRSDELTLDQAVHRGCAGQREDPRLRHGWRAPEDASGTRHGCVGDGAVGRSPGQRWMRPRRAGVESRNWVRFFTTYISSWQLTQPFSSPQFTLRGHTSTVRCLKMSDAHTAISGSRDTTLRIWDLKKGLCKHVLIGHQASVRCLEIHGDIVVSGSYDTTAKIWSISEGKCLRTLTGHFSQIYAIAFDGKKIATGSLDTSVRIWDPNDG